VHAALADHRGDVVVAVTVIVRERLIAGRLLDRVEIGALHVLDDASWQRFVIGRLMVKRPESRAASARCAARQRRRPPMISNESATPAQRPHHDRLDDAAFLDRGRKLIELASEKIAARLLGLGYDELDRNRPLAAPALASLGDFTLPRRRPDERRRGRAESRSPVIRHGGVS